MKIKLGSKVKSIVSNFKGIVTGYCEYLNGCKSYLVQPAVGKDGIMPKAQWIDEPELKVLSGGVNLKPKETVGGPRNNLPPSRYLKRGE